MPLEPASQAFLARLAAQGSVPVHLSTPALARMSGPAMAALSGRGPAVGAVENYRLTESGQSFRIRVLKPEGEPRALLVYFHGGGWVLSDIDLQYDHVGRQLVDRTQATVVLVNYRKAPEYPFPVAIEDSYAALQWVAAHRVELAGRGVPLIVAGDSAGGNITAVMTLWARDGKGPQIDYQVLIYPVTDCDLDTASSLARENQLLIGRETMAWFWQHYLPDPQARTQPDASPLRATRHAGLPPALVYVAEYDPLHDEGVAYAAALRAADVPVVLEEARGEMHGYFQMANILPGQVRGIRLVSNHINRFVDRWLRD